jgi:hypothetical protein
LLFLCICVTHTHVYNIGGGALYISNVRLACNKMGNCAGVAAAAYIIELAARRLLKVFI